MKDKNKPNRHRKKLMRAHVLHEKIRELQHSPVRTTINNKIAEFAAKRHADLRTLMDELCFCILAANCSAEMALATQQGLRDAYLTLPEKILARRLRRLKYRFYNVRAKYLIQARAQQPLLQRLLLQDDERSIREWLVKSIAGIGYKEASHFLRNVGFRNVAIVDYHILDLLSRYSITPAFPTITPRRYLAIENTLSRIASKLNLTLAELDLYLWYLETGKVIK